MLDRYVIRQRQQGICRCPVSKLIALPYDAVGKAPIFRAPLAHFGQCIIASRFVLAIPQPMLRELPVTTAYLPVSDILISLFCLIDKAGAGWIVHFVAAMSGCCMSMV